MAVIDCGEPELDGTVQILYTNTTYLSSGGLACLPGFEKNTRASNITQVICMENGTWTSYEPCIGKEHYFKDLIDLPL